VDLPGVERHGDRRGAIAVAGVRRLGEGYRRVATRRAIDPWSSRARGGWDPIRACDRSRRLTGTIAGGEEDHPSVAMFLGHLGRIITRLARDPISDAERLGHSPYEYAAPTWAQQALTISRGSGCDIQGPRRC
jgi:hypothetical protein